MVIALIKRAKSSILQFCKLNPSFVIIVSFIYTILLTKYLDNKFSIYLIGLFAIFAVTPLLIVSLRLYTKFIISSMIALTLSWYSLHFQDHHYSSLIVHNKCGAIIEAEITDMRTPGDTVKWLPIPKMVKANVLNMRYSQKDSCRKVNGEILIKFPRKCNDINFNDKLELSGYFINPKPPLLEGGFEFKDYLQSKNVSHLFIVNSFQSLNKNRGSSLWVKCKEKLLVVRDSILSRMSDGMELKYKKMLAAILFGCRQGLNYNSKEQFIESGVMHIFAISGLHIGMLALTLYLFLSWIPFRSRHIIIPILLFLYVLTTGMQPSAMRALLMISVWSIHRSMLRSISPLNAIFIAAVIILIYNPLQLIGAGFQYSFTIATILTLSWCSVKGWIASISEHQYWKPNYKNSFHFKIDTVRNNSLNSLICSFMAWLTGTGLNLLHRNLFIPGAIFANFIILPFVGILFFVAAINLILLPFQNFLHLNYILEFLLKIIDYLSFFGAEYSGGVYIVPSSIWLICLYFIAIIIISTTTKKIMFLSATVIIIINMIYWHLAPIFALKESNIAIIHGGESQTPSFIIIPPNKVGTTIINCGSNERSRVIIDYLHRNGINSIDTLIFLNSNKASCAGSWLLFSGINVRETIFRENYKKSKYARSARKSAIKSNSYLSSIYPLDKNNHIMRFKRFSSIPDKSVTYNINLPSLKFRCLVKKNLNGVQDITLIKNNIKKTLSLWNSNTMKIYRPF